MDEHHSLMLLENSAHEAASRAARYAHATMKPSGYWLCELRATVSFTAQYIVLRMILATNPLSHKEKRKFRVWIESQQNNDGSFGLLPKDLGKGHLSTTTEAYLALKLLGVGFNELRMQAARQHVLQGGGLAKVGVTTQILLALLGLVAWSELPQIPPELMLLPTSGPFFSIYSLAYWARTAAVPIIVLRHHQPVYHGIVPGEFLDELWVDTQDRRMTCASSPGGLWQNGKIIDFIGNIADKTVGLLEPGLRLLPTRSLALAACVRFILDRVDDGGYGAFWASNFGAVLALRAEGLSSEHPVVTHLLKAIDRYLWEDDKGLRMQVTHGPVWDTGLMALGLLETGYQAEAMNLTIKWFKDHQILYVSGDCHKQNSRLALGGWCYQDCNTHYPDNDDTLVSLLCIVMYKLEELSSEASLAAIEFLLGMQCANGGWACFDGWNNRNRWLSHTPFGRGNEFFDPSVPDITGRVLECFGLMLTQSDAFCGKTGKKLMTDYLRLRISHACRTAIQYLRTEQDCYGRWGSRWHVNYLNGTSSVLCGMKYFPEDIHDNRGQSLEEELIQRPLSWLESVQNEDGGWGEGVSTYRGGSERERANSTPTQTAWAIMGLLAHRSPTDVAIVKGIQYLVSTQTTGSCVSGEDGAGIGAGPGATWRQREYVSVGFPDILWLDYSSSRHGYPMMALGRWLHEVKSRKQVDKNCDAIHH